VAATTVRPVAGPQSFRFGALLHQQLTIGIEKERRKRTMQDAGTVVARSLRQMTLLPVVFIDKYQLFGFGRNHPV
jgi:hypothetical protein